MDCDESWRWNPCLDGCLQLLQFIELLLYAAFCISVVGMSNVLRRMRSDHDVYNVYDLHEYDVDIYNFHHDDINHYDNYHDNDHDNLPGEYI